MMRPRSSEKESDSITTMHGGSPLNHVEETGEASGSGMAPGGNTTGTSGPTLTPAPVTGSNATASNTTVQRAPSVLAVNNPAVPHYQFQRSVSPHFMTVKTFNGRGSVIQWWKAFITYMMIQKITDAMTCTFFPSYLEGDAEQWYHSVSDTMKTSVSRIKDALFTRYCPSKLSVELIDINQSETETVDEYIHRVLKQCTDTDMSDISKMTKAMKSLKPALGNTIYCYSSGPNKHGGSENTC
jgi:hypothetical protein